MRTARTKLTASLSALAAGTLLLVAVPTGATHALYRPPMPCIAIRAGVYPVGSGFCPSTAGAVDWHRIARLLGAAGPGAGSSNMAHHTPSPM